MSKRLGDDDGHAVDLLLDKTATAGQGAQNTMYAAPGKDGFERRLGSVEMLLRLLGEMPAEEPSADLVARTLKRAEGTHRTAAPAATLHPAVHAPSRPEAS